jgi:hypothetical protein
VRSHASPGGIETSTVQPDAKTRRRRNRGMLSDYQVVELV